MKKFEEPILTAGNSRIVLGDGFVKNKEIWALIMGRAGHRDQTTIFPSSVTRMPWTTDCAEVLEKSGHHMPPSTRVPFREIQASSLNVTENPDLAPNLFGRIAQAIGLEDAHRLKDEARAVMTTFQVAIEQATDDDETEIVLQRLTGIYETTEAVVAVCQRLKSACTSILERRDDFVASLHDAQSGQKIDYCEIVPNIALKIQSIADCLLFEIELSADNSN